MLAAMHVLAALGEQDGTAVGAAAEFGCYQASGGNNSTVADAGAATAAVRDWAAGQDVDVRRLDGPTVTSQGTPMWRFNLRASNTEPSPRLNVEAADEEPMARVRDDVLSIVRGEA